MPGSITEWLDRCALRWPLLAPAAGFWIGAAIAFDPPRWVIASLIGAIAIASLCFATRPGASMAPLALAGLLTGGLAAHRADEAIACPPPAGSPRPALGWLVGREPSRDGRTDLVLQLSAVEDEAFPLGLRPLHCRALLSTGSRAPSASEGDQLWLPAADWEEPRHLYNPGSGDSASQLTDRGIGWVASLKDGAGLVVLDRAGGLAGRAGRLRRRFQAEVERKLRPSAAREILLAVGLGQRATLSPETRDRFQDVGSGHLLSAGALYLALLTACLNAGLAWLWVRSERLALWIPAGRAAAMLSLPLPLAFALASGVHTAGERASILIACLLLARVLGRGRPDRVHLCALAALGLIALRPEAARDAGVLLAAAAVAGIAAIGAPLARVLSGPDEGFGKRLRSLMGVPLALSLGAWLTTWPFLVRTDHRVSWTAALVGALGLPLGAAASLCGMLALAIFSVRPRPAGPLIELAAWLAGWLDALVGAAARLPGARTSLPALGWLALISYGVCLLGTALALRRIRFGAPLALAAGVVLAAALSHPTWVLRAPALRITFLSVGQGDSIAVELPLGGALVIDGGGSVVGSFDPGREVVAPFLWDRGLSRLQAVVLSHPHPDHANGLAYLLSRFPVAEFWSTGEPCPLPACDELAREIADARMPRRLFSRDHRELVLGGLRIEALYPLTASGYFPDLGENDNSLTLKLSYGAFSALLPGDLEAAAETRLLADPTAELSSVLLKAPHHGSDTSSTPEFVRRVAPAAVVFSVGPRNRFDFPRATVVDRYRAIGARLFRTDQDGAVTFESDGKTWSVVTTAPK